MGGSQGCLYTLVHLGKPKAKGRQGYLVIESWLQCKVRFA